MRGTQEEKRYLSANLELNRQFAEADLGFLQRGRSEREREREEEEEEERERERREKERKRELGMKPSNQIGPVRCVTLCGWLGLMM